MAGSAGIADYLMDTPQVNRKQIDDLRAWFFAKDRSISLAQNCLYYLFTNQANGSYASDFFISETILSVAATSVTFSNIPQNFGSLRLIINARSSAAAEIDTVLMRFNNDSGAFYDVEALTGNGVTASASAVRGNASMGIGICEGANSRGNNFGPSFVWIFDYSRTVAESWAISLAATFGNVSADADLFIQVRANRWRNLNQVTSIMIMPSTGPNFAANSRFSLYGVL